MIGSLRVLSPLLQAVRTRIICPAVVACNARIHALNALQLMAIKADRRYKTLPAAVVHSDLDSHESHPMISSHIQPATLPAPQLASHTTWCKVHDGFGAPSMHAARSIRLLIVVRSGHHINGILGSLHNISIIQYSKVFSTTGKASHQTRLCSE